jgi:hypothetical protein
MITIFTRCNRVFMKKLLKFYLLSFVLLSDFLTYAQPGDTDGGGPGGLEGGDPEPAPINSKLILLAIAGILFVIYTFRKSEKQA